MNDLQFSINTNVLGNFSAHVDASGIEIRQASGSGPTWHSLDSLVPSGGIGGIRVNEDTALCMATAYSCINRIATDVSRIPLGVYRRPTDTRQLRYREAVPDHYLNRIVHVTPDGERPAQAFRQAAQGHLTGRGNAIMTIERLPVSGRVEALLLCAPGTIWPQRRVRDGKLYYERESGGTLRPENVVHLAGFSRDGTTGYSPIGLMRRAFELGFATETSGIKFFSNGSLQTGFIRLSGRLGEDAKRNLVESMARMHQGVDNSWKVGILEEGHEWIPMSINPEDAQFLSTRRFQKEEIWTIFGIPPHKAGDYNNAHFTNIEAANTDYLLTRLDPELATWESHLNMKLLTEDERKEYIIDHDFGLFFRADIKSRMALYKEMFSMASLTSDEIRMGEGFAPLGAEFAGDQTWAPVNFQLVKQHLARPTQAADPGKRIGGGIDDNGHILANGR
jgi:HK97 family phage portal protein